LLFVIFDDFMIRGEKTAVLAALINKTNTQEMKWIIMIILKGNDWFYTSFENCVLFSGM